MAQNPDIKAINPRGIPSPPEGVAVAGVKAGDWLFISGQCATDHVNGLAAEVAELNPYTHNMLAAETHYVMQNMAAICEEGGANVSRDGVRIYQWFTDKSQTVEKFKTGDFFPSIKVGPYAAALAEHIDLPRPASTAMAVSEQLVPGTQVLVDATFRTDGATPEGFSTPDEIPSPVIKYSPALRRGDFIFLAGEVPVDWRGDYNRDVRRGEPNALADEASVNPYYWYETEIEAQVEYTLWKQSKVAEAAGSSLGRAVKAEVYLADPADFSGMDSVWRRWFGDNPPARTVLPYMGMAGKGVRVEIAFHLLANDSSLEIEVISTDKALPPLGHEPQAVRCGDLLFLSTQIAHDGSGVIRDDHVLNPAFPFRGSPAAKQMRSIRENVEVLAGQVGASADDVVRMLSVFDDLNRSHEAFEAWFAGAAPSTVPPAITALGLVNGPLLVLGAHLALDLTLYAPQ